MFYMCVGVCPREPTTSSSTVVPLYWGACRGSVLSAVYLKAACSQPHARGEYHQSLWNPSIATVHMGSNDPTAYPIDYGNGLE